MPTLHTLSKKKPLMADKERNALIPLPAGGLENIGSGPKSILSGRVSDALALVRARENSLAAARFRIGEYEFRDPDYRQILIWATALGIAPEVCIRSLEDSPLNPETYHLLTSAINQAWENGDLSRLREIAHDPRGFILGQGWVSLDFGEEAELKSLQRLFETLQLEIVTTLESRNMLHESAEFEMCRLYAQTPGLLKEVATGQMEVMAAEMAQLQAQAKQLEADIAALTGDLEPSIEACAQAAAK